VVKGLTLVAIGAIPPGLLDSLSRFLSDALHLPSLVSESVLDPARAYDKSRGQYDSRLLLPPLEDLATRERTSVLGVTDVDIFSSVFTFVFGEAQLGGKAAIVSLHRLHPTFYGLSDDPNLVMSRARRETLHEAGHLLGLVHCAIATCVMSFSGAAEDVDLKSDSLCIACQKQMKASRGTGR
jgi:archaemetzincin